MERTGNSLLQRLPQGVLELFSSRSPRLRTEDDAVAAAFDRTLDHFAHGHWPEAFKELVPLADSGHREAARIALLMTARGPRLFGRTFTASPCQRDRWREAATRAYAAK